jgi:hypothetical protein
MTIVKLAALSAAAASPELARPILSPVVDGARYSEWLGRVERLGQLIGTRRSGIGASLPIGARNRKTSSPAQAVNLQGIDSSCARSAPSLEDPQGTCSL